MFRTLARIPAVSVSRVALSTSKRVVGGTNAYPVSDKLEAITGDSSSTYADAFAKVSQYVKNRLSKDEATKLYTADAKLTALGTKKQFKLTELRTLVSANIHKPEKSKKVPSKISSQLASIVGNDAQYRDALSKVWNQIKTTGKKVSGDEKPVQYAVDAPISQIVGKSTVTYADVRTAVANSFTHAK